MEAAEDPQVVEAMHRGVDASVGVAAGAASNRVTVDNPHRRARPATQGPKILLEWVANPQSGDVFFYGRVCE